MKSPFKFNFYFDLIYEAPVGEGQYIHYVYTAIEVNINAADQLFNIPTELYTGYEDIKEKIKFLVDARLIIIEISSSKTQNISLLYLIVSR